jgi:hypothetical protein
MQNRLALRCGSVHYWREAGGDGRTKTFLSTILPLAPEIGQPELLYYP